MRAITPVFSVLLILVLSVVLVGLFWLFATGTFSSLASTGTSAVNESLTTISSCMKIESVSGNQVSLRNCGKGSITQNSLAVYLDDIPLNVTMMSPAIINQDGVGTVTLSGLWNFNAGGHTLRVTNPRVVTDTPVNAVLPDSAVLDLEFDEGSGNIAHDSSGQGNDFVIQGMPNITWTSGKFNNGVWINSSLPTGCAAEYTTITNAASLPDSIKTLPWGQFTISMWVNYASSRTGTLFHLDTDQYVPGWFSGFYMYTDIDGVIDTVNAANSSQQDTPVSFSNNLPLKAWNYISYAFDNTVNHTEYIYANGVEVANASLQGVYGNVTEIDFGVYNQLCEDATSGNSLDSIRIYNETLTPDQTIILKPVSYD